MLELQSIVKVSISGFIHLFSLSENKYKYLFEYFSLKDLLNYLFSININISKNFDTNF